MSAAITLGPYHVGEIPPILTVTFKDSSGVEIDLTGYTAQFSYRTYGGVWVVRTAVRDADQTVPPGHRGQTHYTWVVADFAVAGDFEGEMWVGNAGTQRFDSQRLNWQTLPAVVPIPTI